MERNDIEVWRLYKAKNKGVTLLKKFAISTGLFSKLWYEAWIDRIDQFHTIIIFATTDYTFIRHINRVYPHIRLIFWYWNPAFRVGLPKPDLFNLAEVWSFDPDDCAKFNLKFNTTFFFKGIEVFKSDKKYDILFLGINKGRREYLNKLQDQFEKIGVTVNFLIVPDKREINVEPVKPISYEKYLKLVSKTRCILDLMPVGQSGLTLRPMEAIFLNVKLVSNDLNLLQQSFYHPNNVFLLGHDRLENFRNFLEAPYQEIDKNIVYQFDFDNWLNRFN